MQEAIKDKVKKPLDRKNYGSVPHFHGSRVGSGDWHIPEGQASIACEKVRDSRDRVIVTEKLDGSNVGVARIGDSIVPLIRAGYHAKDSPHQMHHLFAEWVAAREIRFRAMLQDGERVAGEWLLLAHGTRYAIRSPDSLFVAFDILVGDRRRPYDAFVQACAAHDIATAALLSDGPATPIAVAINKLGLHGFHHAIDQPEGAVWRVERDGNFEFMAKYVPTTKIDGAFFPEITGAGPVWNWPPDKL
jgi:hypothetical protein